jgi:hypothetical protein
VESKKKYKLTIRVRGDEGIAEYVRVAGNIKLSAELKVRFFKYLKPGTLMRLNSYKSALRSDIAGRKGAGEIVGAALVIYKGLDGLDALYEEIPTTGLYLPCDWELIGEDPHTGDVMIPRRRNIAELGIYGMCTGTHGHFGVVDKNATYQTNDGNGNLVAMPEDEFAARGLAMRGIVYDEKLLKLRRIIPPREKKE